MGLLRYFKSNKYNEFEQANKYANSLKKHAKTLSSNCEHLMEQNLKTEVAVAKFYTQAQNQHTSSNKQGK